MKFWQVLAVLFAFVLLLFILSQNPLVKPVETVFSNEELASDSPSIGNQNAKVVVVEFSDYQCPACKQAEESVKEMLKEYGGKVKFVYRNFPLYNVHPLAGATAQAALAAGEQGKFWEMHDALFENQEAISVGGIAEIKKVAKQLGLDEAKFNSALDSGKFADAVKKDFNDALRFGCKGTPVFFINGKLYFGSFSAGELKGFVDAAETK